jgi:hypothetical protein
MVSSRRSVIPSIQAPERATATGKRRHDIRECCFFITTARREGTPNEVQGQVDALPRMQAETAAELDALLPAVLDRAFRGEL